MVELGPSADYKLALRTHRNAAIALSSSVAGIVERRDPLRDALRGRIAAIHRAAKPALGEDEATAAAVIVNQVMKMVPALATTEDERAERLVGEARKLMALYIIEFLGGGRRLDRPVLALSRRLAGAGRARLPAASNPSNIEMRRQTPGGFRRRAAEALHADHRCDNRRDRGRLWRAPACRA
jgi:hypothetical protein